MNKIKIHPSILCANHGNLANEIKQVNQSGADYMHIDVMDGNFVPNFGCGTEIIKIVKEHSTLPMDVHLMINDPNRHIKLFCGLGADIISIHPEADKQAARTLAEIKEAGVIPGIAINPGTSVEAIKELLPICGHVLVMTVNPGYGGQQFLNFTLDKIYVLGELSKKYGFALCVDGGVSRNNIKKLVSLGVTNAVVGNALFTQDKYGEVINNLHEQYK